ncbi:MAG: nucleoside-triphosphatase [Bacillota bacterium]|nr:nucleoside-triphosphatase [Bacillota bacterium]
MVKNLFLLGKIGTGKSTLIRNSLLPCLDQTGGFFVQRVLIGGVCVAFRLLPVTNAEEYLLEKEQTALEGLSNIFLWNNGRGNWQSNFEVFWTTGVRCLHEGLSAGKKLILLDEIGGIELHCPPFMEAVKEIIAGPLPVLGVFKAPPNAETLEECLAGNGITSVNKVFIDELHKDPVTELFHVDRDNMDCISEKIKRFVEVASR